MKNFNRILWLIVTFILVTGCASKEDSTVVKAVKEPPAEISVKESGNYIVESSMQANAFETLCVPTQFTKICDDYFIVDCYHNQIITSKDKNAPLNTWQQMTDQINMGHTIAGDGYVYLCDDTENNRVLVFVKENGVFYLTQKFEKIGERPHFIVYDEKDEKFYALSSLTGEMYIFSRESGSIEVELLETKKIEELDGVYVRSFSFIDDDVYMPAGNGKIYVLDKENFLIKKTYDLPPQLGGPTQVSKINGMYYLTVSTDIFGFPDYANIVRADTIEGFNTGEYEEIKHQFCEDGTPYVITPVDDGYYLAWHSDDGSNCMWYFETDDGEIKIRRAFE